MPGGSSLIEHGSLRRFFQESVDDALRNQQVDADDHTVVYLVNLLIFFSRSENFFTRSADGKQIRPLALYYKDALNARGKRERYQALRSLGDMALFLTGLFAERYANRLVDVNYCISMGGNAYRHLAESMLESLPAAALRDCYSELSAKFVAFADVLAEVADQGPLDDAVNLLKLYEHWSATGSRHAADRLKRLGIVPVAAGSTQTH